MNKSEIIKHERIVKCVGAEGTLIPHGQGRRGDKLRKTRKGSPLALTPADAASRKVVDVASSQRCQTKIHSKCAFGQNKSFSSLCVIVVVTAAAFVVVVVAASVNGSNGMRRHRTLDNFPEVAKHVQARACLCMMTFRSRVTTTKATKHKLQAHELRWQQNPGSHRIIGNRRTRAEGGGEDPDFGSNSK